MANCIQYWRKKRGITQEELAKQLGIDRPILSRIENPEIPIDPDEDLALKIARILNVFVTDIFKKDNEEKASIK